MADYSAYNSMIYLLLGAGTFLAMRWASRLAASKKRLTIEYRENQAVPPKILRQARAEFLRAIRDAAASGNRLSAIKLPATSGQVLGFLTGIDRIRFGREEEVLHLASSAGLDQRPPILFESGSGRGNMRAVLVPRLIYENAMLNGSKPVSSEAAQRRIAISSSSQQEKRRQVKNLHLGFPGNFLLLYNEMCGLVDHYDI
jgi:hypothetical protein